MIDVPVCWLSYNERNPRKGRWDQNFLARLLAGEEGRVPQGYNFVEVDEPPTEGGVVVFSAGFYAENGQAERAVEMLVEDLQAMAWCVLIATSDECQTFPWGSFDLPSNTKLWVMLPRVDHSYPPGTRFIGEGSPTPADEIYDLAAFTRDLDVSLIAQGGHERRTDAFAAMRRLENPSPDDSLRLRVKVSQTPGFTQGVPLDEYLHTLTRSWIVPAPSGVCSQSSFRAYEALEAGCIPILDNRSPQGNEGFWEVLGLGDVAPRIDYWRDLPSMAHSILANRSEVAALCSARWQQHKRRMLQWLHDDVSGYKRELDPEPGPWDEITVIIPTSPIPSNPDISMIQATVASIRTELPGAEILITCDGVRDEQLDRKPAYDVFLHRLAMWANTQFNVWPFIFTEHLHQSGMMHAILPEVRTPYVLYVEHDAPLEGTIPWADVLWTMDEDVLYSVRFLHETAIPPGSEHLFLDHEHAAHPRGGIPYARTIQWSQRPHVARTDWYRQLMAENFAPDARTMIEDVMHGVVQAGTYAGRKHVQEAWRHWRMAVFAPEGSWKRSGHANGRGDDPKLPMLMKYPDGQRPEGAPPEGWQ